MASGLKVRVSVMPRWARASPTALITAAGGADRAALAHPLVPAGRGRRRLDVPVLEHRAPRPWSAAGSRGTCVVSGLPSSS